MRNAAIALATFFITTQCAVGQELTEQQMGPWNALNEQVTLNLKRDWDGEDKFVHPKLCIWGDTIPSPVSVSESAKKYFRAVFESEGDPVSHHLVPVTVVVAGDVAIINAYLHILTKPDDEPVETIYRLHNTWKKEGNQWQLLATYNTVVASPEADDE